MKITLFTNQSIESASGLGRHIPLAKELVKLGHSVTILCLHHNTKEMKQKKIIVNGVKIINVGQMHVIKRGNLKYKLNKLQLFNVILNSTFNMFLYGMKTETDIIYLCKPQPINSTAALIVKFLKGKKLILDCDDYEAKANNFDNVLERKVFELFEDNVPRFSNLITTNTLFLKNRLIKLGYNEKKIFVLPNGIEKDRFKVDNRLLMLLKKRLKLGNKKVILYFGALDLETGHPVDLLIRSFNLLKKEIPNSILLIIGGGTDLEKLESLSKNLGLENEVIFLGKVSPNLMPTYIKLGHVSIDPVNNSLGCEGRSPLKIFESMIMKVPVVTGSLKDRSYILKDGSLGYLVKPNSEESLKEGIIKALKNKNQKKKMDLAFKEAENYYWSNLAKRFNEIIKRKFA